MSNATVESLAAGLAALLALPLVSGLVGAPLAAALIAGAKAIADHANGDTDAATMMARVTSTDQQATALDAAEDTALDAKFDKAP